MQLLNPQSSLATAAIGAAVLLGGLVAAILAIRTVQGWARNARDDGGKSGRGDWENALAGYKNLRDQGVLSDEEYRKIRTLVEPHLQQGEVGNPPAPPKPSPPGQSAV
jgi:hypothetical protein